MACACLHTRVCVQVFRQRSHLDVCVCVCVCARARMHALRVFLSTSLVSSVVSSSNSAWIKGPRRTRIVMRLMLYSIMCFENRLALPPIFP